MRVIICALLIAMLGWTHAVDAAMTSTHYQIPFDSLNSGGTDYSTSTNYKMNDTLGEQSTGYGSSTNYLLHAGYRQADEAVIPTLAFDIGSQENSTKTAYVALTTSTTQTVTLASNLFYATGSHIGVVENEGLGQKFIVGKVIAVNGLVLTVDKWDGMTGGMSLIPSGGDDFVYRLDGHAIQFGTINILTGATGIMRTEVSTNAQNGYSLNIQSDGYLRNGLTHIHDVADGSVTLGQEEYGAQVYGYRAVGTGLDFAVSSTLREIQNSTSTASDQRIGMIYKIAINGGTPAGSYVQNVVYLLTARF